MTVLNLTQGSRIFVDRLLESSTLDKWFEVSPAAKIYRGEGKKGIVMGVFKPHYYENYADGSFLVEVYHLNEKKLTFYIPEELLQIKVPNCLRMALKR